MNDEIGIHHDDAPRLMGRTITSERINHYSDVISHMVGASSRKFYEKHGHYPSPDAVKAYEGQLIDMLHFRQRVDMALKIPLTDGVLSS